MQWKYWLLTGTVCGLVFTPLPYVWATDGAMCKPASGMASDRHSGTPDATQTKLRTIVQLPEFERDPDRPMHHWEIRSSVQVSRSTLKEAYVASRDAYTRKLARYAKVSDRDAARAITVAHPGMKVENLELRNVRTNLVYIAFAEDDEDRFVVVVDAGNGQVLMDRRLPTHHERAFAD